MDECVKVRASSQVGVTERLVLVSSPAACVLFSAEYQVFCTKQVQNALVFSLQLTFSLTLNSYRRLQAVKTNIPSFDFHRIIASKLRLWHKYYVPYRPV